MKAVFRPIWVLCVALASTLAVASESGRTLNERVSAFESGLRPAVHRHGTPVTRWSLVERMNHHSVPGFSVAVVKDGKHLWSRGYGVKRAGGRDFVDTDTVFSTASLSKLVTAAMTLKLVEAGELDLTRDIGDFLVRWQVPPHDIDQAPAVSLRALLSHTGGFAVPNFPDFLPDAPLPGVLDTLEGRPPAVTGPARLVYAPGSASAYSGAGYTVVQLLIEDVVGRRFTEVADDFVLVPLGMSRSTFLNPLPESFGNIAMAHDAAGETTALPRGWQTFPELAASGLWATPSDMARLIIALIGSYKGHENAFLSKALVRDMMTEVGASDYGLGPALSGEGMERRFMHGGSNDDYKSWMEGHIERGSGFVIMANGAGGFPFLEEVRRALADAFDLPYYALVEVPDLRLEADELDRFTGKYVMDDEPDAWAQRVFVHMPIRDFEITREADALALGIPGRSRAMRRLIPVTPTRFLIPDVYLATPDLHYLEFIRSTDGKAGKVVFSRGRYAAVAQRANES